MAVQGSPIVDTNLGDFDHIESFVNGDDYKEACEDLEYHEQRINEQNTALEATLKRLQEQAQLRHLSEEDDSDQAGADTQEDQAVFKAKAETCQVNIAVAAAKQEELQRLIEALEPRPAHAL